MLQKNLRQQVEQVRDFAFDSGKDRVVEELDEAMKELDKVKSCREHNGSSVSHEQKIMGHFQNYRIHLGTALIHVEYPDDVQETEIRDDLRLLMEYT